MFLKTRVLTMYAESAIHAGAGSDLGAVDLPIQRERTTGYPLIQASSVKGALRSHSPNTNDATAVFGPFDSPDHAGALSPGDARILLFPVRALRGVFVWTTSVLALARFKHDLALTGATNTPDLPLESDDALISDGGLLVNQSIVLEEFSFTAQTSAIATQWAQYIATNAMPNDYDFWQARLRQSLVILPQDAFRDFVVYATEVVTRIKLDPGTKTVQQGALFSQELLPADSLLYVPVHAAQFRTRNTTLAANGPEQEAVNALNWAKDHVRENIQIGGDETVGRGLVRLHWMGA